MISRRLYIAFAVATVAHIFGCGSERPEESEQTMTHAQLAVAIKGHLASSYPEIQVRVEPWEQDPSRTAIYFVDQKFSALYPQQRYHYLIHNIPDDFFEQHLSDSVWFELASSEKPEDLRYPDEEVIESIALDVIGLLEKSGFFAALDDIMAPECGNKEGEPCHGDFRITKRVLAAKGFREQGEVDEVFDVCHVLMSKGAFCDCEVLYNAHEGSRMAARYWKQRVGEKADPDQ